MTDRKIELTNGDIIYMSLDRRNDTLRLEDLYKYTYSDNPSNVISNPNGKYVARENDLIYSFDLGMFRASSVDPTTYVTEITPWDRTSGGNANQATDLLVGFGPATGCEGWRAFLDTTVFPYRLSLDDRWILPGSENTRICVFYGTNVGASGEIISAYYDHSDTYIDEFIPLEIVAMVDLDNRAIKTPKMGYCRRALNDGEVVTAVTYNDQNMPTRTDRFVIHRTNIIRRPHQGDKRITSIELLSPYLSKSIDNQLEVPINVSVATMAVRGKVNYSDGESRIMDISDEDSNGKFRLAGLKYWSPTIAGPSQDLTLIYRMDPSNEYSRIQGEVYNNSITEHYKIKAVTMNAGFSLKLFAFPTWIDNIRGWGLEYWLYDLERTRATKLPLNAVELVSGSDTFEAMDYIRVQNLGLSVNLGLVSDIYGEHRHVQNVQIALLRDGSSTGDKWKIKTTSNQGEWYGEEVFAEIRYVTGSMQNLSLSCGSSSLDTWLDKVYYRVNPLVNQSIEVKPPRPTHMKITTIQRTVEVPVEQWNTEISILNDLGQSGNIYVQWIRRMANTDLQLGVSAFPVRLL